MQARARNDGLHPRLVTRNPHPLFRFSHGRRSSEYAPLRRVRQLRIAPQWGVALSSENAALLKRFGANVRRERMRLRLTQEKLAEKVGLNPRTIQKIEAGDLNVLVTTAAGIEKALGCGWGKMMGE